MVVVVHVNSPDRSRSRSCVCISYFVLYAYFGAEHVSPASRHQDDNGRKRFFERCLDYHPLPARRAVLMNCRDAQSAGIRWRRVNPEVHRAGHLGSELGMA